ncbi:M48 family metalloprotease [Rhodoferax sp. PAMC 29310]|uniref:M48 family metalloprotease n=1 Tax=Rhodoferax sp. PAMC 29310 TaxID=2822760 RepID=UPI001F0A5752|nr:M48 family metalloprotease [Rhodoferax sp. PAMC 29310]
MAGVSPLHAQTVTPARNTSSSQLPTLGDGSDMTLSAERRLGDRIARGIYRDPDYIDDPVLTEYVQNIWKPLMAAARLRGDLSPELQERFAWEIMLGKDRTVNAFAMPGGYFGLHLGLIAVVTSRDELASVLGHELSHVTQRHIARLMTRQSQQTPWMIGAMVLGALAASKSPDAGSALIVGGQAMAAQNQLNFSREMEREADRVGFGVMTQAGFEAQGFVTMFDKLQQASRLNDNGAYPYLRSHPLTTERIADMQARQPLGASSAINATLTAEHAMAASRASVLANAGMDALRSVIAEADSTRLAQQPAAKRAGVLYGAALAATQLRDFKQAQAYLTRLRTAVESDAPATRLTDLLAVEIALAANQVPQAAQLMAALSATAKQRPELMLAASVAARSGQRALASGAAQNLQVWVTDHPTDAGAWQQLATLYAALGQTLRAIRAEAETQVARLDYAAGVDRLRAAQDLILEGKVGANGGVDHIEASIIDTRKREVELRLKEQTLDKGVN